MNDIQLKELHQKINASFGEFAGWNVPMIYSSTIEEHKTVRNSVGVFDISHMGRLKISGKNSLDLLEIVFTKKLSSTKEGFMSGPTLSLNESARVIDDEMWYKINDNEWLAVPNASAREIMITHLSKIAIQNKYDVKIQDLTFDYVLLALQGPESKYVMEKLKASWALDLKPLEFRLNENLNNINIYLASRSGWTGEDGFEFWLTPNNAERLYKLLLDNGVKPIGIAARDTLRIEMGFVLGGNEYGQDPIKFPCALSLRYGMGAIDWNKTGYIGEPSLRACKKEGLRWIRIGLEMKKSNARYIPRHGYKMYEDDIEVGWVTSGTYSPILEKGIGMGYIDTRYAILGETITINDGRGRTGEAKIVDFPLIKRK
ncbi:MAG: glycine cleavage system protein T [Caldisphaera sp.]|nr:MAG: glycine cleavage system protein T [Caldisphaera sp.]PMP92082.1 MAG: glycine cleavage system protein T [Caldisphaera sp.]